MVRSTLTLLLVLFAPFASAQIPGWSMYYFMIGTSQSTGGAQAVCSAAAIGFVGAGATGMIIETGSTSTGDYTIACLGTNAAGTTTVGIPASFQCRFDATQATGPQQNCPVTPAPSCASTQDVVASSGFYEIGTNSNTNPVINACINGCVHSFEGSSPSARALVNGTFVYYAEGQYVGEGESCTTQADAPASTGVPTDTCPSGEVLGSLS